MVYRATTLVKEDFAYEPHIRSDGGRKFGFQAHFRGSISSSFSFLNRTEWPTGSACARCVEVVHRRCPRRRGGSQ